MQYRNKSALNASGFSALYAREYFSQFVSIYSAPPYASYVFNVHVGLSCSVIFNGNDESFGNVRVCNLRGKGFVSVVVVHNTGTGTSFQ